MSNEEFAELFETYMAHKRDEMKEKYNRVLPSGELIFNRFDKGEYLKCGENSSVYDTSVVMGDVVIGDHVWVGPYTLLDGSSGKLEIGDYTSIDSGVMIYTHDSTKNYVSGGVNPFEKGDVSIGSYTVVGSMSIITCGVSVGSHCVIGANSFINKDVPDYSIVAGTPAKIIGKVIINDEGEANFEYFQ
ncbi:MAG: acyltransferase [Eubacterium sp.]|nr:acyltransferase [Eubacterium sp.]